MKNLKLFGIICSAILIFSSCTQQTENQALQLAPDEAESKIAALETQVSELQNDVSEIQDDVGITSNEVKITYDELFAIAKDIFEQTVDTDLECIEDANFGVPDDIDKTGFISATYRTNDNDIKPMYIVSLYYDNNDVYKKMKDSTVCDLFTTHFVEQEVLVCFKINNIEDNWTLTDMVDEFYYSSLT